MQYDYEIQQYSNLKVTLEVSSQGMLEFPSKELWDAEALHHFGFAKLNGKPYIEGYFSFKGR